jgi:hypothetical protein
VISIFNVATGREAIAHDEPAPPWRIQLAQIEESFYDRRHSLRGRGFGKTEIVLYFLAELVGAEWTSSFSSFEWMEDDAFDHGTAIDLRWVRDDDIVVSGRVELTAEATDAEFKIEVSNPTALSLIAVEYPIVNGIGQLGKVGDDTYLAHCVDGGFLFANPYVLFRDEEIIEHWLTMGTVDTTDPRGHPDEGRRHGGLYRARAYPNGFEGSPMQFFTYFEEGVGGFYFASHDPLNTDKMLNFYAAEDRQGLTASFVHYSWDWTPGIDIAFDYPTLLGATTRGTWHEAADRYRRWATATGAGHPDWCDRGTLRDRVENGTASRWLVEEVGFNTFGLPVSIDMSQWYEAFHRITEAPVLHVVGHDWKGGAVRIPAENWQRLADMLALDEAPSLQDLADILEVEPTEANESYLRDALFRIRMDLWDSFHTEPWDFLPPAFEEANINTIAANGDRLVPFYLSDFFGHGHDNEEYGCLVPYTPFTTSYMCPTTEYWQDYHAKIDVGVVRAGAEGLYYDVSACCAAPTLCLNRRHGHPIGFGRGIIKAYEELFKRSKEEATAAAGGTYIPLGTELVVENLVGEVDFAQCRAGAGVQATMEGEEFIVWQKNRRAVKIPMFAYVYHEYGPVLMDGWAQVSHEFGDIFYEIAARVALEGGLLQLNYEFAPPELFEGMEGPTYQLGYTNKLVEIEKARRADPAKLRFIREVAVARTGYARDYLAYGRMVEPLRVLSGPSDVTLKWSHFNSVFSRRIESGEYTVPDVTQVGWQGSSGVRGYLFVNLLDRDRVIQVEADPVEEPSARYDIAITTSTGSSRVGTVNRGDTVEVSLPARRVVLVEMTPA